MKRSLKLSVLDIGPIRSNQTSGDCFDSMVRLAELSDDLGYHRYWLAEHHNVAAVAASQTPVFSAVVGAHTKRIRIGGCVLFSHYAPLLIAEQMGLLEACYPGRVDVGIGRSSGTDWATASLLRSGMPARSEDEYVDNLMNFLSLNRPEGISFEDSGTKHSFRAVPNAISSPDPWILGTSSYSASLAAELGLPYAFGYHIRADGAKSAISLYKERFKPSLLCPEPKVMLSVIVVIGETTQEAERLSIPQLYFMSAFRSGEEVHPQLLVEQSTDLKFPARYQQLVHMFRESWIIDCPDGAAEQIERLASDLGIDEIMINPVAAAYSDQSSNSAPNREFTLKALAQRFPQ